MENQFLSKLIKNAPRLNWFHFLPFNLLTPCCPWAGPPPLLHPPPPPPFALSLSPGGNYLHKSFFALWFAPFHKWRLSLFNRAGFASHVKAYNVAGPWFLHTPQACLPPSSPSLLAWASPGGGGGGAGSKVKAYWAWGSLQWIRLQTHWLNWKETRKLLKITSAKRIKNQTAVFVLRGC